MKKNYPSQKTVITAREQKKFSIGEFEMEPEKRLLTLEGKPVHLARRPFQVLLYLIENRDRVVSRKELLDKFWDGHDVYEVALSKCIGAIRKALNDKLDEPRFIETRWSEGYRFIFVLEELPIENFLVENGKPQEEPNFSADETSKQNAAEVNKASASSTNGAVNSAKPSVLSENVFDNIPVNSAQQTNIGRKRQRKLVIFLWCLLLVFIPAAVWFGSHLRPENRSVTVRSIAVTPLKNLTGDSEQDYLADGMTESLIASLSKIEGLKVISRGSVFTFKDKETDPKLVGRQLDVETILEGSVQRNGESLRVEVRLVSTKDGSIIWSGETYERSLKNIITLQDEIARGVVTKLRGGENQTPARSETKNPEARQLYMKGRFFWNKRTGKDFSRAIEFFNQAVALDPDYALAYAGIADTYLLISPQAYGKPHENFPKAKEAAEKALSLEPDLAEAHASRGHLVYLYEWNWAKAEESFNRAINLNPNYATAYEWRANFLSSMGRHEEALASIKRAHELDPFSLSISNNITRVYYHAGDYDRAIEQGLKTFELNANNYGYNSFLDMAYARKGNYDKAVELRLRFLTLRQVEEESISALKRAYKSEGWTGFCREELNQSLQRIKRGNYILSYNMARAYARLGETEQTLQWLEKAYAEHSDHLVLLKVDPLFDFVRQDSRFQDLLRRIGF